MTPLRMAPFLLKLVMAGLEGTSPAFIGFFTESKIQ
jgi:hypothetical protein